jgi:hypothetical protein
LVAEVEDGGAVRGALLRRRRGRDGVAPAADDRGQHPHAVDHLGVARDGVRPALGRHGGGVGLAQQPGGGELGGEREREQDQRAPEGDPAHHRVQAKITAM